MDPTPISDAVTASAVANVISRAVVVIGATLSIFAILIGVLLSYLLIRAQRDLAVFERDFLERLNGRYILRVEGLQRLQALDHEVSLLRQRVHDLYNELHRAQNQARLTSPGGD